MNVITIKEAKDNFDHIIQDVLTNSETTIVCGDKGEKAVLLTLDEYNSWQETLYLLSNPANVEHLRASIHESLTGKTAEKKLIEI